MGAVSEGRTLFCRSWLCVDCAPRRIAALARLACDGQPTTFLTLTVNPAEAESACERAKSLSDAFKVLIKRARRKFTKGDIQYLAVFEETKRGEPHLHILLRAPFIPQKWISETMLELINAPIVDIRRVGHARNAARYVSKYLAKGPKPFANLKRYWMSQGYDLDLERKERKAAGKDTGWRIWQEPLFMIVEQLRKYNIDAIWKDEHSVIFVSHQTRASPQHG